MDTIAFALLSFVAGVVAAALYDWAMRAHGR